MTLGALVVVVVVVTVACSFQASIGFGANLIAQPIVYQFDPDLVPGSVMMATFLTSALVLWRDQQSIELRPIGVAAVGAVGGIGVGVVVIRLVSEAVLGLVIACCVLVMVAIVAFGSVPARTRGTLLGGGVLGGFGSATAGIGGPPIALLFSDAEGHRFRPALAGYIMVTSLITFVGLAVAGRFGPTEIGRGLALLPSGVVGFAISGRLVPIVDRAGTRPAVLVVSAGAAVSLLVQLALGR